MRFQRRIRIAPGLRMNLSGSGIGFSVGPRGMSFSAGPRGLFAHAGIPGTGISHAEKIGSSSGRSRWAQRYAPVGEEGFVLKMQASGEPLLLELDDRPITDEARIRRIRRSEAYKQTLLELSQRLKEITDERTNEIVDLFKSSPETEPTSAWTDALAELKLATYDTTPYESPKPTEEDVRAELNYEAMTAVSTWKFWQLKRLRAEYVAAHTVERLQSAIETWSRKKAEHDSRELEFKTRKDAEYQAQFEQAKRRLEAALTGEPDFIRESLDDLFEGMSMPFDFSVDFDVTGNRVALDLDLPEIENMPIEKATVLASGKVKVKEKSRKEVAQDYARCVTGLGMYGAAGVFNISPQIAEVMVSAYTQRPDKATGNIIDDYVYSVRFTRPEFAALNFPALDPVTALTRFEHRLTLSRAGDLESITPLGHAVDA